MSATLAPPAERRITPRRRPTLGTVCYIDVGHKHEPELGLVWNISSTGISMLVSESPRVGHALTGTLLTMDGETARAISVRVAHVKKLDTGDYLVGGPFSAPLSADELQPFVA